MTAPKQPLRVGVGGPVGSGKTALMEQLCKRLRDTLKIAAITNDIYTKEDARILVEAGALPAERIMGVETGGCPHTAIREDASINLAAIAEMRKRFQNLDVILIESGGDNLAATFSPELADLTIYVIDVSGGEKNPAEGRARGHPLGPARHQQDRPRPLCRRLAQGHGARRRRPAQGETLRHGQHENRRRRRPGHRIPARKRRAEGGVRAARAADDEERTWDPAIVDTETAPFSARTTWGILGREFHLLDVLSKRLDFHSIEPTILHMKMKHNASSVVLETSGVGIAIGNAIVKRPAASPFQKFIGAWSGSRESIRCRAHPRDFPQQLPAPVARHLRPTQENGTLLSTRNDTCGPRSCDFRASHLA